MTQACREGDLVVLSSLLESNVNDINETNECGLSPLHYAARNDQGQVIQLLIDHGAGKNIKGAVSPNLGTYQMVIKLTKISQQWLKETQECQTWAWMGKNRDLNRFRYIEKHWSHFFLSLY